MVWIALEIYLKKFKYSVFIFFDKAGSSGGWVGLGAGWGGGELGVGCVGVE